MNERIALGTEICGACAHWLGERERSLTDGSVTVLRPRGCCRVSEDIRAYTDVCHQFRLMMPQRSSITDALGESTA